MNDDLVRRGDAINAVEDFFYSAVDWYSKQDIKDCVDALKDVQSAVILCRDCKHYQEVMYKGKPSEYGFCDRWADGTRMKPEDYCSRADGANPQER